MSWIPVAQRLPDDRRRVLAWGLHVSPMFMFFFDRNGKPEWTAANGRFLGVTRCNLTAGGGTFDVELGPRSWIGLRRRPGPTVTHWCEIEPPGNGKPPLRIAS